MQAQQQYQEHALDSQPQSTEPSQSRQGGEAEHPQTQGMYEIEEQPEERGGGGGGTDQQEESPLQESLRVQRSPHRPDTRAPNERVMNVLQVSSLCAVICICPCVQLWICMWSVHMHLHVPCDVCIRVGVHLCVCSQGLLGMLVLHADGHEMSLHHPPLCIARSTDGYMRLYREGCCMWRSARLQA